MRRSTLCYIEREGKLLLLYRNKKENDPNEGKWIGVGGKIEEGETPQQALIREIQEELETKITIGDLIRTVEYDYPAFHLSMQCFWCEIAEGELKLLEAEEARWLTKETLYDVTWLPADITLVAEIKRHMKFYK